MGTETCRREGYQLSRYWCKERHQFSQLGRRNGTDFQYFRIKYKVGYAFRNIGWHVPNQNLVKCIHKVASKLGLEKI